MKKIISFVGVCLVACSAFLLTGCGEEPVMNASSEARFQESFAQLSAKMSPAQKEEFMAACMKLRAHHEKVFARRLGNPVEAKMLALMQLSDKTPKQIIAEANAL